MAERATALAQAGIAPDPALLVPASFVPDGGRLVVEEPVALHERGFVLLQRAADRCDLGIRGVGLHEDLELDTVLPLGGAVIDHGLDEADAPEEEDINTAAELERGHEH